jgi:hypothetical protein
MSVKHTTWSLRNPELLAKSRRYRRRMEIFVPIVMCTWNQSSSQKYCGTSKKLPLDQPPKCLFPGRGQSLYSGSGNEYPSGIQISVLICPMMPSGMTKTAMSRMLQSSQPIRPSDHFERARNHNPTTLHINVKSVHNTVHSSVCRERMGLLQVVFCHL